MHKIQRISKIFKWILKITFLVLPLLMVIFWIDAPTPVSTMAASNGFALSYIPDGLHIFGPLSITTKTLAFLLGLVPLAVHLFVLYFLIRLFTLFERGVIFSELCVKNIRYIGYTLFVGQLISPMYQALLSLTLTWNNPVGQRVASISFSGTNIGILLTAFLIILISWIMAEGYKIKQEQQLTI
ncbi:MAG: DUF2975 domain-containing protein [Coxiellaceae bacterium]|nr:DUF2975 domain-containing protein [Coxiellaceae bacterium]